MRHGGIKTIIILIHILILPPLCNAQQNDSSWYGTYEYFTIKKLDFNSVIEYMDVFQKEYLSSLARHGAPIYGSYIKKFIYHRYFRTTYYMESKTSVTIFVSFEKPIFSFQRQFNIQIEFDFEFFPPYEKEYTEWPDYTNIVNSFMSRFDDYVAKSNLQLLKKAVRKPGVYQ